MADPKPNAGVRVAAELKQALQAQAGFEGRTLSNFCEMLLGWTLEQMQVAGVHSSQLRLWKIQPLDCAQHDNVLTIPNPEIDRPAGSQAVPASGEADARARLRKAIDSRESGESSVGRSPAHAPKRVSTGKSGSKGNTHKRRTTGTHGK